MLSKLRSAAVIGSTLAAQSVYAAPDSLKEGADGSMPTGANANLFGDGSIFKAVADTLIFIVGAVSVIMLIIGGLRYVLSGGESSAVKGAKDTILYAIIGIVVAALAYAAVNFVVGKV